MYKTIVYFTDLLDKEHPYNPGDIFPRKGLQVAQSRIDELASSNNKRGKPLIEKVEDNRSDNGKTELEDVKKSYTRSDITRMPVAELRSLATKEGIENADNIAGAELKNILIEKLGL